MRQSASLIWLAACSAGLFLGSCQTAPKLAWRIVDPSGFVGANLSVIHYDDPLSGDETCVSSDDSYRIIKACKQGVSVPDVVFCSWDLHTQLFGCSDDHLRSTLDLTNWACLTGRDWDRFLTYCQNHHPQPSSRPPVANEPSA